jgi:hypothetical protein
MIDTGYRLSLSLFDSFSEKKKKKGDSTSQLELGVGLVGIMQAGTWEFEVS